MRVRAGLRPQVDGSDPVRFPPSCRNHLDAQETSHMDNESSPSARAALAGAYAFARSPDEAELSMAAMTSWRRTASAKSGTV